MGIRAIKRNFAKKFKSEERDKHPGLKKASVGKKLEKERLERLERGEEEKPNDVFAGRSFGGKFNM